MIYRACVRYFIQIYNFNVYKLNIRESCNNAIYNMGIKLLSTLLKIMTECGGLDIMTRADKTEEPKDPTELTELTIITE